MHLALQIDEILTNILSHCNPPPREAASAETSTTADFAALARTCRLFREPALDALWSELRDLSPLARCLPKFFVQVTPHGGSQIWYALRRSLTLKRDDWDVIRSYTRRIRSVKDVGGVFRFHYDNTGTLLNPPIPGSLFPNLRHFGFGFNAIEVTRFLDQPFPSLISLDCSWPLRVDPRVYSWRPFRAPPTYLDAGDFFISTHMLRLTNESVTFNHAVCSHICRWLDPRIVSCDEITLNLDAIEHLSRVSNLTRLSFTVEAPLADEIARLDAPLRFNRLQELEIRSEELFLIPELLSCIEVPAIVDLTIRLKRHPSKQAVASFLAVLQSTGIGGVIQKFGFLHVRHRENYYESSNEELVCDDLRPLMTFGNLRILDFDLEWSVGLTDNDLVELVSSWPHMEHLFINQTHGWLKIWTSFEGGVTLDGIGRLLQTRPSLKKLALAIDTRNSVERPWSSLPIHFDQPRSLSIDSLDSLIEVASIPAVVTFFTHLVPSGQLSLELGRDARSHLGLPVDTSEEATRWDDLSREIRLAFARQRLNWRPDHGIIAPGEGA